MGAIREFSRYDVHTYVIVIMPSNFPICPCDEAELIGTSI
jgi:hypothetical protein